MKQIMFFGLLEHPEPNPKLKQEEANQPPNIKTYHPPRQFTRR